MKTEASTAQPTWLPNAVGRDRLLATRGDPLLLADWDRTLMMHYEVPPAALQPFVPFDLDLREGRAYVSLVAFTMRDMRPWWGGAWTRALFRPIATHEFLNVRTYVTHRGEPGIHFLAEWLPNRLSVAMGCPFFGLPYRHGALDYQHHHERGSLSGSVLDGGERGALHYEGHVSGSFTRSAAGSLTEFLMERYSAFTEWLGRKRRFRIWHAPWLQCAAEVRLTENTLMPLTGSWTRSARLIGASYSPGVSEVWMGRPVFI